MLLGSCCGCGTGRPITYYGLAIPAAPTPSTFNYPIEISVARVRGSNLLENTPIVYKTGANQISTYDYHRWTEAPVQMVQTKLIRILRASGQFQAVSDSAAPDGEIALRGRLYDFEEVDGATIDCLVSMEFELYDRKDAKILWSRFYSQSEPVEGKQVSAVVAALDRNLDRGLKDLAAGINQFLAADDRWRGMARRGQPAK
jgi:ABC-type uncharacterized transport system auxiliary subunit